MGNVFDQVEAEGRNVFDAIEDKGGNVFDKIEAGGINTGDLFGQPEAHAEETGAKPKAKKPEDDKPFISKALQFITGTSDFADVKPEVEFSPSGDMQVNMPPSAYQGWMSDPMTALAFGATAGMRAAAPLAGKAVAAGREAVGWLTGGATEVPTIVKGGAKGIVKAIEEPRKAARMEGLRARGADMPVHAGAEFGQSVLSPVTKAGTRPAQQVMDYWETAPVGRPMQAATPEGAAREVVTGETEVAKMYRQQEKEIAQAKKRTLRGFMDGFQRQWIDVAEPAKRLVRNLGPKGAQAERRRDLIIHSPSAAGQIYKDVTPAIYEGLSKEEHQALDWYIQSKRIVDIDFTKEGIEHPYGLTGGEHQAFIEQIGKLSPALQRELERRANIYFDTMRSQVVTPLLKEGLITEEQAMSLAGHNYEPRKFIQHIDPDVQTFDRAGKVITAPDSGIQRLKQGSTRAMETDSSLLLAESISRTQARIFKNRANRSLYELATENPENGVVRVLGPSENVSSGHDAISVMIDGSQQRLEVPREFARSWIVSDPVFNRMQAEAIQWVTGTKILKGMATGYNPAFALRNFPRDMLHTYLTTDQYSSHLPVWFFEMMHDYGQTAKAAWTRGDAYKQYMREGGMGEYLTHQGGGGSIGGHLAGLKKVLGYVGESSEIWTRLALRNRAIRNGMLPEDATWVANNYLDFQQGGSMAKALDNAMPYFNASIQGTRGLFRAAHRDPKTFIYKVGQLVGTTVMLYNANLLTNPECWKNITDREKVNNFIVTTPWSFKDSDGNTRYLYFKVAKDQSQRAMSTAIEALMARDFEGKFPSNQVYEAFGDLFPITPESFNMPFLNAINTYVNNKDFWSNRDIWSGEEVDPYLEYYKSTNPAWIKAGEVTGLSPVRMERAAQKIFTFGNPYTDLVGGGIRAMMDADMTGGIERTLNEKIVGNATVKGVMNATPGISEELRRDIKESSREENSKRLIQNRGLQKIIDANDNELSVRKRSVEYINSLPAEDRGRMYDRLKRELRMKDIPNRSYWLDLAEASPEARAALFLNRYNLAKDEKEKLELVKTAQKVPGFWNDRFAGKLKRILNDAGQKLVTR